MTNVVQLRNTGNAGFTRMDNQLYEALIGADLSGRELRVALAIHRLTAGYNVESARISASFIAEMAGLDRANVSRIINDLIRQGVVCRSGGSRDPIGIAPVSCWRIDKKSTVSKTTQSVKKQRATVSFLTHNKDSKDNTPSDEGVSAHATDPVPVPADEPVADPGQPVRKRATRLPSDWALPADWLSWSLSDRPEFTERDVLRTAEKFADYWRAAAGRGATKLDWFATWRNWFRNERSPLPAPRSAGPDFHSGDTSWANDLGDL